jgi:uncharacterized protein YqjF (DUF2071 family)
MYKHDSPSAEQREALRKKPQDKTPVIYQEWLDLLFLHWEYPEEDIKKNLPPGLKVDTFNGKAYLGMVPFFMRNFSPKGFPALPYVSDFLELNVRTYVYDEKGNSGIWFFSLDADQSLAVWGAKTFFHLDYFHAKMSAEKTGKEIHYKSQRYNMSDRFESYLAYEPEGASFNAAINSLEYFLTERYLLFSYDEKSKTLYKGRIHHKPYDLYNCKVKAWDANPLIIDGFNDPKRAPEHILYSDKQEVDTYFIEKA